MLKKIFLFFITPVMFLSCSDNRQNVLHIAVAANMQFATEELIEEFEKSYDVSCEMIVSSSGKLTSQIIEGAPYDIFLSADKNYPEEIHKSGLSHGPPVVYAHGALVLWTMKKDLNPSLELLTKTSVRHVAIPNPKLAPYGLAALQILQNNQLDEALEEKLVYGENVAQSSQFVLTGAAEIGFSSKSLVLAPHMQGKGRYIDMDSSLHSPIEQAMIMVKNKRNKEKISGDFQNFLLSSKAQVILQKYGYQIVRK